MAGGRIAEDLAIGSQQGSSRRVPWRQNAISRITMDRMRQLARINGNLAGNADSAIHLQIVWAHS
jgi:hypothetical protein